MQELQETWVQSLNQEDPLEEGMATHSSILSWRIPWMEELNGLQSIASQRAGHNWSNLACTHAQQTLLSTQYVYHLKRFIKSSPWLQEVYDLLRERILSSLMVSRRDVCPWRFWVLPWFPGEMFPLITPGFLSHPLFLPLEEWVTICNFQRTDWDRPFTSCPFRSPVF